MNIVKLLLRLSRWLRAKAQSICVHTFQPSEHKAQVKSFCTNCGKVMNIGKK